MIITFAKKIYWKLLSFFPWMKDFLQLLRFLFILYPKYLLMACVKKVFGPKHDDTSSVNRYVTYTPTGEGIGGLMVRYVTAKCIAEYFNLIYLHKPFPVCFHYDCDFDDFLGYNEGEALYNEVTSKEKLRMVEIPEFNLQKQMNLKLWLLRFMLQHVYYENNTLFIISGFSNAEPHVLLPSFENDLYITNRKKYVERRKTRPIESFFDETKIKVGVHVRRAEIRILKNKKDSEGIARWRGNEWYLTVIEKINETFGKENTDIQIFSDEEYESEIKEFTEIGNTTVHLKKNDENQPFHAFHAMVISDIAVCSVSGFSIESARLSGGIKIIPTSSLGYEKVFTSDKWIHIDNPSLLDLSEKAEEIKKGKVNS